MSRVNVKELLGASRVVLPTYTTTQRDAIPEASLEVSTFIFNSTTLVFEFWDGAAWTEF